MGTIQRDERVLIVERQECVAGTLSWLLNQLGFQLITKCLPGSARSAYQRQQYQLVVVGIDPNEPRPDLELLHWLEVERERTRAQVVLIALVAGEGTNEAFLKEVFATRMAGADYVGLKPINQRILSAIVGKTLPWQPR